MPKTYQIPKEAQREAQQGLKWRRANGRGGTAVGVGTARALAAGGTLGIEKVKHIARYFPRHEPDKKAEGFRPGEQGFPSNGRIAWALWGGDAAWTWARDIVETMSNRPVSEMDDDQRRAVMAKLHGRGGGGGRNYGSSSSASESSSTTHASGSRTNTFTSAIEAFNARWNSGTAGSRQDYDRERAQLMQTLAIEGSKPAADFSNQPVGPGKHGPDYQDYVDKWGDYAGPYSSSTTFEYDTPDNIVAAVRAAQWDRLSPEEKKKAAAFWDDQAKFTATYTGQDGNTYLYDTRTGTILGKDLDAEGIEPGITTADSQVIDPLAEIVGPVIEQTSKDVSEALGVPEGTTAFVTGLLVAILGKKLPGKLGTKLGSTGAKSAAVSFAAAGANNIIADYRAHNQDMDPRANKYLAQAQQALAYVSVIAALTAFGKGTSATTDRFATTRTVRDWSKEKLKASGEWITDIGKAMGKPLPAPVRKALTWVGDQLAIVSDYTGVTIKDLAKAPSAPSRIRDARVELAQAELLEKASAEKLIERGKWFDQDIEQAQAIRRTADQNYDNLIQQAFEDSMQAGGITRTASSKADAIRTEAAIDRNYAADVRQAARDRFDAKLAEANQDIRQGKAISREAQARYDAALEEASKDIQHAQSMRDVADANFDAIGARNASIDDLRDYNNALKEAKRIEKAAAEKIDRAFAQAYNTSLDTAARMTKAGHDKIRTTTASAKGSIEAADTIEAGAAKKEQLAEDKQRTSERAAEQLRKKSTDTIDKAHERLAGSEVFAQETAQAGQKRLIEGYAGQEKTLELAAKMRGHAEKEIADARRQLIKAGLVTAGYATREIWEESKIADNEKKFRDQWHSGHDATPDVPEPRDALKTAAVAAVGTRGNALEKQFRFDTYETREAAYRAHYDEIKEAAKRGDITPAQEQRYLKKIREFMPDDQQGRAVWTFAPALTSFITWKAGELKDTMDRTTPYKVVDVLDADTVRVTRGGKTNDVRLLDFNSPEIPHPGMQGLTKDAERKKIFRDGEYLGQESTDRLREILKPGQYVNVVKDSHPKASGKDVHGTRELGYIDKPPTGLGWAVNIPKLGALVPGTDIGKKLLTEGYGDVRYRELSGPVDRGLEYDAARKTAKESGKNVWSPEGQKALPWVGKTKEFSDPTTNMPPAVRALQKAMLIGGDTLMVAGNTGLLSEMGPGGKVVAEGVNAALAVGGALEYNYKAQVAQDKAEARKGWRNPLYERPKWLKTDFQKKSSASMDRYRQRIDEQQKKKD